MRCWLGLAAIALCGSATTETIALPKLDTHLDEALLKDVQPEAHEFRAETGRLMEIIVNSLYTERDVFLRELISNAADALEKVRVRGLKDASIYKDSAGRTFEDLTVLIKLDKPRGEVSIIDSGIGMTKEELETNLGTVAKSGTEQFIEAAQRGASASNLIGQFGVGFYSAYLVADEITVTSKSPFEDKQWVWHSSSQQNGFKIFEDPRPERLARGTIVTLKLKPDAQRYLSRNELRKVARRFSTFVPFPLYLGEVKEDQDDIAWQRINSDKPLWLQDKSEIEREQYESFYKNLTSDSNSPLAWTHFKAEGDIEFSALMYIPASSRRDVAMMDPEEMSSDVKLYVQRVLISDKLEDFFPKWLSFVKGVIDSNDLPLKVDREAFSSLRVLRVIKKKAVSKILDLLRTMGRDSDLEEPDVTKFMEENPALSDTDELTRNKALVARMHEAEAKWHKFFTYNKVWETWGSHLMMGCADSAAASDRPKILSLFRGRSSTRNGLISLDTYISRMKPGQKNIYYITGDDLEVVKNSPYLEYFLEKKIEVVVLLGPFDEACFGRQKEYKGYNFRSVERDTFDYDEFAFLTAGADVEAQKAAAADAEREYRAQKIHYKPLLEWAAESLGLINAQYVVISKTLSSSPSKVSSPSHGFTAAAERMARTSLGANRFMVEAFAKMKTFELNPHHWLIHHLLEQVNFQKANTVQDLALQREVNHTIDLLYESSLIASGFPTRRPHIVTNDLYLLLSLTKQNNKYSEANPFSLAIPDEVYIQVDRELKTEAAKAKKAAEDANGEKANEEEDYQDLFDHDEL